MVQRVIDEEIGICLEKDDDQMLHPTKVIVYSGKLSCRPRRTYVALAREKIIRTISLVNLKTRSSKVPPRCISMQNQLDQIGFGRLLKYISDRDEPEVTFLESSDDDV